MKKLLILVSLALLLCIAIGVRSLQVAVNHIGTGESIPSPDKKYEATAHEWWSESFWGSKRHWYEFTIRNARFGNVLRTLETTPIEGPYFGSRSSHQVVTWNAASTVATFDFPHITISMTTTTDEGP